MAGFTGADIEIAKLICEILGCNTVTMEIERKRPRNQFANGSLMVSMNRKPTIT